MNVVSILHVNERNPVEEKQEKSSPALTTDRFDIEIKVPQDIHHLLQRISQTVEMKQSLDSAPASLPVRRKDLAPARISSLIADIKKVSYRMGWLDGQEEIRSRMIPQLRSRLAKKEQEYHSKIMKLSLLLNSKNLQIVELEKECITYQDILRLLHNEKDNLKEHLHEVRHNRDEIVEFLEASKERETRLSQHLSKVSMELEALKRKKWWEFWKK
jgi:chromosome segregation ATPase